MYYFLYYVFICFMYTDLYCSNILLLLSEKEYFVFGLNGLIIIIICFMYLLTDIIPLIYYYK